MVGVWNTIPSPVAGKFLFGSLGAAMAHLITYNEYVHHYADSREPRKMAL